MDPILVKTTQQMAKAFELLQKDLVTVRTGRATPALVDNIIVSVYAGSTKMKIVELATVTVSDPHTLVISPYDASILEEIQKGIQEANTGLTPNNDGQVIRINIPPLSEERRKDLIHLMKQKLENGKIMIRQARHDAMADLKKDASLSEDDIRRIEKEVQNVTDEYIDKIHILGKKKEEDLMQI